MELHDYLRYYNLENYLLTEVSASFQKNKTLTPEEFLAIIIWKSERSKTDVLTGLCALGESVQDLMTCVSEACDLDKVKILSGVEGMGIPIASAVLTVCYPREFTVVDKRACAALAKLLGMDQKALRKQLGGDPAGKPEAYLAYVEKCKAESASRGVELRTFDRMLWGMDFYEGKGGLKELAARMK